MREETELPRQASRRMGLGDSEEALLLRGNPRICQGLSGGRLMYQVKFQRFLPPKKHLNPKNGMQTSGTPSSGVRWGGWL